MTADIPYYTLNNGSKMPSIGKGCWLGVDGGHNIAKQMCKNALQCGYRHLDTAAGYGNEALVGEAIRDSGISRSNIFLTTKLPHFNNVRESFEESLRKLDCGYLDLYLMHWPQMNDNGTAPWDESGRTLAFDEHPNFVDAWKEMEKLLDTGKVRSIGVSNFSIQNLEILLPNASVVPAVNQVEVNPCLPQFELQKYCQEKGILLTAYSPLGQGNPVFFTDPDFMSIMENNQATAAQITMSWLVQRGVPPVAKSANVDRMKKNITLVKLTPEEMVTVNSVHKKPGMHRSLCAYHSPDGTVFGWTYKQLGWPLTLGGFVKS